MAAVIFSRKQPPVWLDSDLAHFHQYLWVRQCGGTFFVDVNSFGCLEANTCQSSIHSEKGSRQNKYNISALDEPPHWVQENPSCQSRHVFGRLCYSLPTLVARSRFNNGWGLTDSKTYKRMRWNVSHVVEGFLHRAGGLRGVMLFNYIQLTTPVCPQGHPSPSSGLIWLPLQRKYEYELLFA